MNELSFKEEDIKKTVEYLNFINEFSKFKDLGNKEIIQYFQLLSYMQKNVLPKMEANIAEIKKIVHKEKESKKTKSKE